MAENYKTIPILNPSIPAYAIPDKICLRTGLNLAWAGENKFGVYAFDAFHSSGQDNKSKHAPCKDLVHHVRATSVLFHPIARKLATESNGYFLYAQKLAKKARTADFQIEVLKLSRQYRSVLRVCLEGFQAASEEASPEEKQNYLQHIPTFYNMELVWHLCEILFLDVLPGHLVMSQLISWIRFHVPHVEKEAQQLLAMEGEEATAQDNYWLVIIDCLLQRRIEIARALLSLHSRANTEPFQRMDQVLRTMPIFEVYGGLTGTEFQVRHECWRKETIRLQRTGHFSSNNHLDLISKIITGDDSVQDTVRRHCETWYQYMVAHLIYTSPAVKVFDLAFHANRSLSLYGAQEQSNTLNWILCAVMEMDVYKMVDRALCWRDSEWLLTHLIHLMHILGKLSGSGPTDVDGQLCENLLLSYGSLMLSHPSLWQVGVDYLEGCPMEGRGSLEALLSRVPFHTNQKALKIIHIAFERGLSDVVYTVAKVQGTRCRSRGHLGAALTWAMKSQDPVFCSQLADEFLKDYMKNKKFQCLDLLENLGCDMMLGDRLVFLGKYCEFLKMKESGELAEAGVLLVSLLKNKVAPRYFWMTMFTDAMSLLGKNDQIFNTGDVMELMLSLEEMVDHSENNKITVKLPQEEIKEIRVALMKDLANALIADGSGPVQLKF